MTVGAEYTRKHLQKKYGDFRPTQAGLMRVRASDGWTWNDAARRTYKTQHLVQKTREWREKHPLYYRRYRQSSNRRYRLRAYGITPERWTVMLETQGHRCAICGRADPGQKRAEWATDHCHTTGFVRGILCHPCNRGIGMFYDDPARLRAAASYLESVKR